MALHSALKKRDSTIVNLLLNTRKLKLEQQNIEGLNAINLAASLDDHR